MKFLPGQIVASLLLLSSPSLQAVTVDLFSMASSVNNPSVTDGQGNVYYGYSLPSGLSSPWTQRTVTVTNGSLGSPTGLGVYSSTFSTPAVVEDIASNEYLVIDFGAAYAAKSAFELKVYAMVGGSVTYFWWNTLPAAGSPSSLDGLDSKTESVIGSQVNTITLDTTLTEDRYLIIGGISPAEFLLSQVSYTSSQVPEAGVPVMLIGAALGALGLASRRRNR